VKRSSLSLVSVGYIRKLFIGLEHGADGSIRKKLKKLFFSLFVFILSFFKNTAELKFTNFLKNFLRSFFGNAFLAGMELTKLLKNFLNKYLAYHEVNNTILIRLLVKATGLNNFRKLFVTHLSNTLAGA